MSDLVDVVRRYYDACNTCDDGGFEATLHPDVVHWFLSPNVGSAPVGPRAHLVAYWKKVQPPINGLWVVDHAITQGDEAVIEWSLFWDTAAGDRVVTRGAEWFRFRDLLIVEIRSYYQQLERDTGLDGFAYDVRGYATHGAESSSNHDPAPAVARGRTS